MTKRPLFPITLFVSILIFLLISGCGHSSVNSATSQPPTLISIAVTQEGSTGDMVPAARSIPLGPGITQQFGVTGTYSDGSQKAIPASSVSWSSSVPGIVSINSGGLVTPISQGTTTLMATTGGITVSIALTITPNIFTNWSTTTVNPVGVAVDSSGSVYVAGAAFSNNSSMIRKYNSPSSLNAPGKLTASFNVSITSNVAGVAVSHFGNYSGIYVTDNDHSNLNIYNSAGSLKTTLSIKAPGSTLGSLGAPTGVAVDSSGNIYVTDARNNLLHKFDSSLNEVLTSPWPVSTIGVPSGVAVDSSGNVYVADFSENLIRLYSPSGTLTTPGLQSEHPSAWPSILRAQKSMWLTPTTI